MSKQRKMKNKNIQIYKTYKFYESISFEVQADESMNKRYKKETNSEPLSCSLKKNRLLLRRICVALQLKLRIN